MRIALPTDLLLRLMNATAEQYAAVERILGCAGDGSWKLADGEKFQDSSFKGEAANDAEWRIRSGESSTPLPPAQMDQLVRRTSSGLQPPSPQCGEGFSPVEVERGAGRTGDYEESAERNVFRRAGSHWDVVFEGGETFHLEDTLGAKYLAYLLHHPGVVISAFDLEVAVNPDKACARSRNSIQEQLDSETVRCYLRELTRLRGEREDAAECGDAARADQLDADIEAVEEALQSNGRGTGDTGERARNNVRKAVGGVIHRLGRGDKAHRQFAAHLSRCVNLGFEVMYQPASGEVWL